MALALVTLPDLKAYMREEKPTVDDTVLQQALDDAHQAIYNACKRQFNTAGTSSDRVYVPSRTNILRIHDCTAVNTVTFNGTVLAPSVYQLEPAQLNWSGEQTPYEQIRLFWMIWYQTIPGKATITVNAPWGWPVMPPGAPMAIKALAKDVAMNRDIHFGLVTTTEYAGIQAKQNVVVRQFIKDYSRTEAWGIA